MSTNVPWRIASQRYTILNAEREPIATLDFTTDPGAAEKALLRIVPFGTNHDATEVVFATGGYVESTTMQPRWLRPFERVDPNLQLDDETAFAEYRDRLPEGEQRDAYVTRRQQYLDRREAFTNPAMGAYPVDQPFVEPMPDPNAPRGRVVDSNSLRVPA